MWEDKLAYDLEKSGWKEEVIEEPEMEDRSNSPRSRSHAALHLLRGGHGETVN